MKMIYVVGSSRSGTTMMGRVLGAHPDVFTFGELHFFEYLWNPESARGRSPDATQLLARLFSIQRDGFYNQQGAAPYMEEARAVAAELPRDATPPHVFRGFLRYETSLHGKSVACDQTPRNVFYIQEILECFPNAYIVAMVRDPRDVLLSQKNRWRRRFLGGANMPLYEVARSWANYHPVTTSMLWNSAVRAEDRYTDHPRVLQVRFEDILVEPEKWIRKICALAHLEFSREMLDIPRKGSSHGPDKPGNMGIDASAAGRWKTDTANREDLAICQKVSRSVMTRHNYPTEQINANPLRLAGTYAMWPVKSSLALALNIARTGDIVSTLRRRLTRQV